jgi:hypothetical protein
MAQIVDLFARQNRISAEKWRLLQAEFLLDLFAYAHRRNADSTEELGQWIQANPDLPKADLEDPVFTGWLLRRTVRE